MTRSGGRTFLFHTLYYNCRLTIGRITHPIPTHTNCSLPQSHIHACCAFAKLRRSKGRQAGFQDWDHVIPRLKPWVILSLFQLFLLLPFYSILSSLSPTLLTSSTPSFSPSLILPFIFISKYASGHTGNKGSDASISVFSNTAHFVCAT